MRSLESLEQEKKSSIDWNLVQTVMLHGKVDQVSINYLDLCGPIGSDVLQHR